ncbi:uncharacterized protein N7515_009323 [Penicillium bovifimosum]|uniref:Pyridoxamine 5'-phosphate oxidase Alr4036 family FMN-binding domain-containing protein n=1 Tax=Penicillium bovifimosum TaxID=126998 RepID=A0A9W9GKC3_9EURO|nr:uncharacterized protein N7515_009323 [Penicillium bovifimosum]KAJ5121362.1 hypothetical protein N7515_009323 [Penicillium bovifimosum]
MRLESHSSVATVAHDAQLRPVPRLRTCGCRGFFPELDLHPKGQEAMDHQVKGGGNSPVFQSDMLCFTTDARMEKLSQLESSGHAIEAVFWLKDLMTQWRIKGTAYAIGDPKRENERQEEASSRHPANLVADLSDPVARANFRVVVIKPEKVERLDLTYQEDGKRWSWKLTGGSCDEDAEWNQTEV